MTYMTYGTYEKHEKTQQLTYNFTIPRMARFMDNNDDDNLPKRTVTRKKLVDLKAVAALLEDGENPGSGNPNSSFKTSEDLIAATARVKSQRDLIAQRMHKMESGQGRVTKAVYDKVHRDYQMQLENITNLLNEKKALLKRELKRLYLQREKQSVEVTRHKEILEEARFRHFLEEFSEEQYKEVEEYETREISGLQSELAQLVSYIKVHEELFDPEDLGYTPARATPSEVTRTMMPENRSQPKPSLPERALERAPVRADPFAEKTPLPEKMDMPPLEEAPAVSLDSPSPAITDEEILMDSTMSGIRGSFAAEEKTGEEKGYFETAEPRSIFDVLEEAPEVKAEVSETSRTAPLRTPAPVPASAPETTGAYKIIFTETEGDFSLKEFSLKDNVSIGRSPSNDLVLQAPKISRQHAAINKYKDQYIVIDLKSSNGVFVNSKKIDEQTLHDGDEISIGGYKMIFQKA